jgi:hypothetical protein
MEGSTTATATARGRQQAQARTWTLSEALARFDDPSARVRTWALDRAEDALPDAGADSLDALRGAIARRIAEEREPFAFFRAIKIAGKARAAEAVPAIVARLPRARTVTDASHLLHALAEIGARDAASVDACRAAWSRLTAPPDDSAEESGESEGPEEEEAHLEHLEDAPDVGLDLGDDDEASDDDADAGGARSLSARRTLVPHCLRIAGAEAVPEAFGVLVELIERDERESAVGLVRQIARATGLAATVAAIEDDLAGRPLAAGARIAVPPDAAAHLRKRAWPKAARVAVHALRPLVDPAGAGPDAAGDLPRAIARAACERREALNHLHGELAREAALLLLAVRSAALAGACPGVCECEGRPAPEDLEAPPGSLFARFLDEDHDGPSQDRAFDALVARGDEALPAIAAALETREPHRVDLGLMLLARIGTGGAAALALEHIEAVYDLAPSEALGALEALAPPEGIDILARRLDDGVAEVTRIFTLLCELHGRDHPRLEAARGDADVNAGPDVLQRPGTPFRAVRDIAQGRPASLRLSLRCRDCHKSYVRAVERAILDIGTGTSDVRLHVLDRTTCPACGAVDREDARDGHVAALLFVRFSESALADAPAHLYPLRCLELYSVVLGHRTRHVKDDVAELRRRAMGEPADVRAAIAASNLCVLLQRWDEAVALAERAVSADPGAIEAHVTLVELALATGDSALAAERAARALRVWRSPDARVHVRLDGEPTELVEFLERARDEADAVVEEHRDPKRRWPAGLRGAWPE